MARKAAVVDVGSNTVRLVVARRGASELATTYTKRVRLGLGRDLEEHGRLSDEKVAATAEAVGKLCARARVKGADTLDVLVTAPGRQAENGPELAAALERAARVPVRILSEDEEARLAFAGAVAAAAPSEKVVAVIDLGGGSTEIAVGRPETGPVWLRSVEIGALRLTSAFLDEPCAERHDVEAARAAVADAFEGLIPPPPAAALVVGGSARALRRVVGTHLGPEELATAGALLARHPPRDVADRFGVGKRRARQLLAAALILAEAQRRLFVSLEVVNGGLRDGALLAALDPPAESAA